MIYKYRVKWERSPGMGCPGYSGKMEINTLYPGEEGRQQVRKKVRDRLAGSLITPTKIEMTQVW